MRYFVKPLEYIKQRVLEPLDISIFFPLTLSIYSVFATVLEGYLLQYVLFIIIVIFLEIGFATIFKRPKKFLYLFYEIPVIFLLVEVTTLYYFIVAIFVAILGRSFPSKNFHAFINTAVLGLVIADAIGGSITWWGFSLVPLAYVVCIIVALLLFKEGKFWASVAFLMLFLILRLAITANLAFVIAQMVVPGFLLFSFLLLFSPYALKTMSLQDNLKKGFLTALLTVGLPIVGYPFDPLLSGLLFSEFTLAIYNNSSHNK